MGTTMLLDCTLRDGGYYTNWDFNRELLDVYLRAMGELPVDVVEIGYRSPALEGYLGEYYYSPAETLAYVKKRLPSKLLAIMVNEKHVAPGQVPELLAPIRGVVDIVRIAVNPERFDEGLALARAVKREGFAVGFNMMYISRVVQDPSLFKKLPALNGVVDYLNLVDSYGGLFPDDVRTIVRRAKEVVQMKIGFHGHDNMELAFANSLAAIESGCEIVDGTVTGMGRGAGNMKTELFLTGFFARSGKQFDFNALGDIVGEFKVLQARHGWGTHLPYMVSGASSLPQKDVMDWMTKRTYSINSIIHALRNGDGKSDGSRLPVWGANEKSPEVLLIAGGDSAVRHAGAVKRWVRSRKGGVTLIHVSAKNAKHYEDLKVPQFFCLVGNEGHRLESVFRDLETVEGRCILPPSPRKMGTYVPEDMKAHAFELKSLGFTDRYHDSHTAIALQTAIELGAKEVYAVGYDGYSGSSIHEKDLDLSKENEYMFGAYAKGRSAIRSLTPTTYTSLESDSVYKYV